MKKYDTVIFDLDGTLLNTLEDLTDSVNYALALNGFPVRKMTDVRKFVGNGISRLIELCIPNGLNSPQFDKCLSDFRSYYSKNMQNKTGAYKGIMELLEKLSKEDYKMAIVSNKFDKAVKELNLVYFGEYIKTAIGESKNISRKPAPDTVFKALEELGASADKALYVGDSEVDVKTAQNSGITSVGVTWGFRDRDVLKLEGADYIIDKPEELLKIFKSLNNAESEQTDKEYKLKLKYETEHFIICYGETDITCIDKISKVLENNYSRVTANLNQKLQEKLTIEIHSDLKELHIALGFPDAPAWIRGGLGKHGIVIASPLNPPPGSSFDNVLNTAVHEFVHIIINKINDNTPRWLNEGIASYEAKDNNENWIRNTIKKGILENALPTFKDLDTGEDFDTFFKRDGYQFSYTITEAIIKIFGYDKLHKLIESPGKFEEIFDLTEKQLEDKWTEFIKKSYAGPNKASGGIKQ